MGENKKDSKEPISCLRNEKIIVRHIPRQTGIVTDSRHVLYGGMAETAKITFVVPRLKTGLYVNVLTDNEKDFLEDIMGLEVNALSIYKRPEEENFWSDANPNGINKVILGRYDNYLDLSVPSDYIKYKILLANKNEIAPSLLALLDTPKATYKFVIISEGDETKMAKINMSTTMQCYKEFGKIENNIDILRVIVETIDGRPTSPSVKLEFLQAKANDLIQADSKLFLRIVTDPLLSTKVLIKKSLEAGLIVKRNDLLFLRDGNLPLCEDNEEATLSIAAKFLNAPKHQEIKLSLEAKLK